MKISKWVMPNWLPIMRGVEFIGVVAAIFVFLWDFTIERPIDRAVRKATLFAQMAQTHALEGSAGLRALRPTILALVEEEIPIEGQILTGVDLSKANLWKAQFPWSDLEGANFRFANLTGANLSRVNLKRASLRGAELSGADLTRANLTVADLTRADLTNANLRGANLSGATLSGANLRRANLEDADLTRADLSGAGLSGAILWGADLTNADLTDAKDLTQEQLNSACVMEGFEPPTLPEGLKPPQKVCVP